MMPLSNHFSALQEEADVKDSEIKSLKAQLCTKESEIASKSEEITDRRRSRRLATEREKEQVCCVKILSVQFK